MRDVPQVEELGAGVWSLPVPIPDNPLGFTYVYLVTGTSGPVLIDTGWNHDHTWDALVHGIKQTGHAVEGVRGALITHFHPDHSGLIGRLREASDAWIAMHPADIAVTEQLRALTYEQFLTNTLDQLRRAGFPEEDVEAYRVLPSTLAPSELPDTALSDGAGVDAPGRDLRALWTPGHSPGHVCFHLADADMLFTGDHLLPRITPHVGQFPLLSTDGDPLGSFLKSQTDIGRLPSAQQLTCLPSHEWRFSGLPERSAEITAHHEERLETMVARLAEGPATLWELTSRLAWRRPWDDMRVRARHMAASETAAHLRTLEVRGSAVREGSDALPRWNIPRGHLRT